MFSPVIFRSLLLGIVCGIIYGFLFVNEKKKAFFAASRGKDDFKFTPGKAAGFSGGVFLRYVVLIAIIFGVASIYEISLLFFAGSFILLFWGYIIFATSRSLKK